MKSTRTGVEYFARCVANWSLMREFKPLFLATLLSPVRSGSGTRSRKRNSRIVRRTRPVELQFEKTRSRRKTCLGLIPTRRRADLLDTRGLREDGVQLLRNHRKQYGGRDFKPLLPDNRTVSSAVSKRGMQMGVDGGQRIEGILAGLRAQLQDAPRRVKRPHLLLRTNLLRSSCSRDLIREH